MSRVHTAALRLRFAGTITGETGGTTVRRTFTLIAAVALAAATTAPTAPSASAASDCTVAVDAYGTLTDSTCMFVDFTLDASSAPSTVTGTIGSMFGERVALRGNFNGVSGSIGRTKVTMTKGAFSPQGYGKFGRRSLSLSESMLGGGVRCSFGLMSSGEVTTGFTGELRVSDSTEGAMCLAIVLAADYLNEV